MVVASGVAPCVSLGYAAYTAVTMGIATFGPTFLQTSLTHDERDATGRNSFPGRMQKKEFSPCCIRVTRLLVAALRAALAVCESRALACQRRESHGSHHR